MTKRVFVRLLLTLFACALLVTDANAATYRVGPGEEYTKVSAVTGRLKAGDVVEITGDIADNFTLTAWGTADEPITIRGVTRVESGRIVRPQVTSASESAPHIIRYEGSWTVIEGLGLTGFRRREWGKAALIHAGRHLVLRNCHIHHNVRAICADGNEVGDILIEFCEFEANGYSRFGPTGLFSANPSATATVQHCYFHDGTGATQLRACFARNVIRYNWFENPYKFALQITVPGFGDDDVGHNAAEAFFPAHSDIVGNVFDFGWAPTSNGLLQLGGAGRKAPGTEGDFHIAHNLFITRRGGAMPEVPIVVHGNVDRIRAYNNAILELRAPGCKVYDYADQWEGPRTEAFRERRGSDKPVVEGSHNWISKTASGIPEGFRNTILGANPLFLDLVNRDFRPTRMSPLAQKGLWPLPEGRIVSLLPEFEPRRGIPVDLTPLRRRVSQPPSIGPFEAAEGEPEFQDDSGELVLSVRDSKEIMQWQLGYGAARRMALEYLSKGQPGKALSAAKMQFLLSPMDERALAAAVRSVKEMLVAVDGNDTRAETFDKYARLGMAGEDGATGTADDLNDPIRDVSLTIFKKPLQFYEEFDRVIDARAAVGRRIDYYTKWWQQRHFDMEKAFARIEGARFDEALQMVVPILLEAIEKRAADTAAPGTGAARRNHKLLERIEAVLSVVARSRTDSVAGAREFVRNYMSYAKYGLAGRDGILGTPDDLDVQSGVRVKTDWATRLESFDSFVLLRSARPESPAVRALETRLRVIVAAETTAVHRLNSMRSALEGGSESGSLHVASTAREFLLEVWDSLNMTPLILTDLTEDEVELAESTLRDAVESGERAVVTAYTQLLGGNVDEEIASRARAYVTAYVAGVNDEETYPQVLVLLTREVAGGELPVFLVEDAVGELEDPLLACRFLDALNAVEGNGLPEERKDALLEAIEEKQYEIVKSTSLRAKNMIRESAVSEFAAALDGCGDYLGRFPSGHYASYMEYQKAYLKCRLKDYSGALEDAKAFAAKHPDSRFIPNAIFVEGVALLGRGRGDAAIVKLTGLAATYPECEAAPEALFMAGLVCVSTQDYTKASECFQTVFDFYRESPRAPEAADLLEKLRAQEGQ